jgi:ubiquitin C-terminal hydrolase
VAEKRTRIQRLSNYLILHLKRWRARSKLEKTKLPVEASLELDMRKFLHGSSSDSPGSSPDKSTIYDLYACVAHLGHMVNAGHYVAFVKHMYTKKWHSFNDQKYMKLKYSSFSV